mmetsp:Transcript_16640/g.27524  ORF Transcript_16640/g.27524 Transcript_16640/m.27524 type:complete len:116 (+) Transcript_16640:257-604(+)
MRDLPHAKVFSLVSSWKAGGSVESQTRARPGQEGLWKVENTEKKEEREKERTAGGKRVEKEVMLGWLRSGKEKEKKKIDREKETKRRRRNKEEGEGETAKRRARKGISRGCNQRQ